MIRRGVIPEMMEDKWFIFLEEDVLYFHRSWTGFCIYQVRMKKEGAEYRVVEALVNRNPSEFSTTDDKYIVDLLCTNPRFRLPRSTVTRTCKPPIEHRH